MNFITLFMDTELLRYPAFWHWYWVPDPLVDSLNFAVFVQDQFACLFWYLCAHLSVYIITA